MGRAMGPRLAARSAPCRAWRTLPRAGHPWRATLPRGLHLAACRVGQIAHSRRRSSNSRGNVPLTRQGHPAQVPAQALQRIDNYGECLQGCWRQSPDYDRAPRPRPGVSASGGLATSEIRQYRFGCPSFMQNGPEGPPQERRRCWSGALGDEAAPPVAPLPLAARGCGLDGDRRGGGACQPGCARLLPPLRRG